MPRSLLAADLFSGAGGFSTALYQVLRERGLFLECWEGLDLAAVNHWPTAIQSHRANHPKARHFPEDVFKLPPRSVIEGALDLLMASPTCTYFSRARGGRPLSWDQRWGRMTPTQVERWAKDLKPTRLVVENVPEFVEWGPVCRKEKACAEHGWQGPEAGETKRLFCGKAIRSRRGTLFRAWVKRLKLLGYVVEWKILNAANYGDATTRKRFFLLARRDGVPIVWPEETHAQVPTGAMKPWTAARAIIDWRIRGKSIFTRKKPLADKTLLRIYAGLIRFQWPERFVRKLARYMVALGIALPAPAASSAHGQGELFGAPAVIVLRNHADARSVEQPLPAVVAGGTHLGLIVPQGNDAPARSLDQPVPTVVAIARTGLVQPLILPSRTNNVAREVGEPVPAVTASAGGGGFGLVEPFTFANQTGNQPKGVGEPIPPVTTGGSIGLVTPPDAFLLSQGAGGAPRAVREPVPTIPTEGAHALIAPFYGASACKTVDEPLGTATTRDRFGLVTPVTHADTSCRARSVEDPLPTVTGAARGELAFIAAAFGEREGQAARVHSVEEPAPTVCAKGRIPLVEGVEDDLSDIDILFRMLEPHELAAAMGFPKRYRFRGNKGDRTRQIGNAVPVATAAALLRAILGGVAAPIRPRRARSARSA